MCCESFWWCKIMPGKNSIACQIYDIGSLTFWLNWKPGKLASSGQVSRQADGIPDVILSRTRFLTRCFQFSALALDYFPGRSPYWQTRFIEACVYSTRSSQSEPRSFGRTSSSSTPLLTTSTSSTRKPRLLGSLVAPPQLWAV